MEIYESHMGGIYFENEILDYDDLYCEQCGDSDTHLGHADTWEELEAMLVWEDEDEDEVYYKYDEDYMKELKAEFETLIAMEI